MPCDWYQITLLLLYKHDKIMKANLTSFTNIIIESVYCQIVH